MGCCSGGALTRFTATFSWRVNQDLEQNIEIIMSGANDSWSGKNTGVFDLTTTECGHNYSRGTKTIRVQINLECTETIDGRNYIRGVMIITLIGDTKFKIRLNSTELTCNQTPMAVWDSLFVGLLGSGRVTLTL